MSNNLANIVSQTYAQHQGNEADDNGGNVTTADIHNNYVRKKSHNAHEVFDSEDMRISLVLQDVTRVLIP